MEIKKGSKITTIDGLIRGIVMSIKIRKGVIWLNVRDQNGHKAIIHQNNIELEKLEDDSR